MNSRNPDVSIIYNPVAGVSNRGFLGNPISEIVEFFSGKNISIDIKTTSSDISASILAETAVKQGFSHVIACGGDGTINQVIDGLMGSNVTLGALPGGTENVFCKAMGVPLDIPSACNHFLQADEREFDVGIANGRPFLLMSGIGMDARIITETPHEMKKALGSAGFILQGAMSILFEEEKFRMRARLLLSDSGEIFESDAWLVLAGNFPQYSGTVKVFPQAEIDDGLLDIMVLGYDENMGIGRQMMSVFLDEIQKQEKIRTFRSGDFTVETDPPVLCQIDGEIIGKTPIRYQVRKKGIKVRI